MLSRHNTTASRFASCTAPHSPMFFNSHRSPQCSFTSTEGCRVVASVPATLFWCIGMKLTDSKPQSYTTRHSVAHNKTRSAGIVLAMYPPPQPALFRTTRATRHLQIGLWINLLYFSAFITCFTANELFTSLSHFCNTKYFIQYLWFESVCILAHCGTHTQWIIGYNGGFR